MQYTPKHIQDNVNVSQTSPLRELFLLLGGLLGILVAVYIVLGVAVDLIVPRLPQGFEQHLAGFYAHAFEDKPQTAAGKSLQELLDKLATELPQSGGQYYVHLIPSSQTNALALPGGHIVVLSALVEELASENELAFILAHELGHFANRDHLRGFGRGLVITAISALLAGVDSHLTSMLMNSVLSVEMKFSQRQETAADLFALELLNKHYGHIAGATDFFQKVAQEETRSRLSYYFATHPYPLDRIATIEEKIQQKGYAIGAKLPLDERLKDLPPAPQSGKDSLKDVLSRS